MTTGRRKRSSACAACIAALSILTVAHEAGAQAPAAGDWVPVDDLDWASVRGSAERIVVRDARDRSEITIDCATELWAELSPDPGLELVTRCSREGELAAITVVAGRRVIWAMMLWFPEDAVIDAMTLVDNGPGLRELLVRRGSEDGERLIVLAWRANRMQVIFSELLVAAGDACWHTALSVRGGAIQRTDCTRPSRTERWVWDASTFRFARSGRR